MANESLSAAKAAKNDEFYTQYYDQKKRCIDRLNKFLKADSYCLEICQ